MPPLTSPHSPAPIDVFISYSHQDNYWRIELEKHLSNLKRDREIADWSDRKIEAGSEWEAELQDKLESSPIILLLISSDFLASKYCYDVEMQRAIERHDAGTAKVIPIILRPCDWRHSKFSKLQVLPQEGKAVILWEHQDSALLDVVQGIRQAVESLRSIKAKKERVKSVFITGAPIEHPKNFFGREKELKYLFNSLRTHKLRNVVIIGEKESGKTSLLNCLRSIATTPTSQLRPGQQLNWLTDAQSYRWIFVDFHDVRMAQQEIFLCYLLESMQLPVPEPCNLANFMDQVSCQPLCPTVILIDNIDVGLQCCPELDDNFWNNFLFLTTSQKDKNLTFVMTTSKNLIDLPNNIFYASTITLHSFTEDEAKQLIHSSPVPFAVIDIDRILADSNCWPSLVQKKCEAHYFYLINNEPNPNFFIGGMQLLTRFAFRPSDWQKQIQHLDPSLNKSFLLTRIFKKKFWKQKEIRQFVIQVLFLLPVLSVVPLIIGLLPTISTPVVWEKILLGVFYTTIIVGSVGLVLGLSSSMQLIHFTVSSGLCILFSKTALLLSHELIFIASVAVFTIGIWSSLLFSIVNEAGNLNRENTGKINVAISVFLSLVAGIVFGKAYDFLFGFKMSVAFLSGYAIGIWRPLITAVLFIPWHSWIYQVDQKRDRSHASLLSKHLVFLDEFQYLRIWGLEKHLLLILEKNPSEGQNFLNRLQNSRQSWAAQLAQLEMGVHKLEKCDDVFAVGRIHQSLIVNQNSADKILIAFSNMSIDVDLALRKTSIYEQCIYLDNVVGQLNNFIDKLTISGDKHTVRFHPISQHWQTIINQHRHELVKEIDSPYVSDIDITNHQQLFIGRNNTGEYLEKLLLTQSFLLFLYGQKFIGKTAFLHNFSNLLPPNIVPLFVNLRSSTTNTKNHADFLHNLAKGIIDSAQSQRNIKLPPLSYETLATDPFTRFDEWLDNLETSLAGNTALLALDEFEVLDRVLNEGRFNENDVLGMLRNLIQHRPKFKVLLAGSHTLEEFQRWSSYLINAQVLHLGYLQESEARQLIEEPIENFALRYELPASQRVIDITRGHPFLIQLLCAKIVAIKNDQDPSIRRIATLADVEAAIPEALEQGSKFFSDIERKLDAPALAVLRYCAQQGEAATISKSELEQRFAEDLAGAITSGLSEAIDLLLRRELIETKPDGYSIQLELIRRWFS